MPETMPQEYDVGQMVRDYSVRILQPFPNLATPYNMAVVLEELQALTDKLEERDELRRRVSGATAGVLGDVVIPCIDSDGNFIDQLCADLYHWRARLDTYELASASVPESQEDDRDAILWTVTAPLLLGYHGGPTGKEIELSLDGYPAGFDPAIQHAPDIATPFSLANQLGVYEEWEQRRWELFLDDLATGAREIGKGAGKVALGLAAAFAIGLGIYMGVNVARARKAAAA